MVLGLEARPRRAGAAADAKNQLKLRITGEAFRALAVGAPPAVLGAR